MSRLTGKCDLYDHIFMIGCKGTTNEMSMKEKFDVFHKRTNGEIFQYVKVNLNKHNIDFFLEREKAKIQKVDKGYNYYGRFYKTLDQINREGFYTCRKIYFDDMFELLPYLGYIIASGSFGEDKEYITLSQHEYNIQRELEALENGYEFNFPKYHKEEYKSLIKEMLEVM